jgi:hypothetical protein
MFVTICSITFPDVIIQVSGWNLFYILMNKVFNLIEDFQPKITPLPSDRSFPSGIRRISVATPKLQ